MAFTKRRMDNLPIDHKNVVAGWESGRGILQVCMRRRPELVGPGLNQGSNK